MARHLSLGTHEQCVLTIEHATMSGGAAKVHEDVTFTVKSGDCTVDKIDGMSAMLVAGNAPGESYVLIDAKIDTGTGIKEVQELLLVHVQGEHAASLGLVVGDPMPKELKEPAHPVTEPHAPMTRAEQRAAQHARITE